MASLLAVPPASPRAEPAPAAESNNPQSGGGHVDLAKLKRRLTDMRARKRSRWEAEHSQDDMIRYVILNAILKGDDLVPRNPDGTIATDSSGRPVERERAINLAMGMVGFGFEPGTSFHAVWPLIQRAIHTTAGPGGIAVAEQLKALAEVSFVRAVGKKIEQEEKKYEASVGEMLEIE